MLRGCRNPPSVPDTTARPSAVSEGVHPRAATPRRAPEDRQASVRDGTGTGTGTGAERWEGGAGLGGLAACGGHRSGTGSRTEGFGFSPVRPGEPPKISLLFSPMRRENWVCKKLSGTKEDNNDGWRKEQRGRAGLCRVICSVRRQTGKQACMRGEPPAQRYGQGCGAASARSRDVWLSFLCPDLPRPVQVFYREHLRTVRKTWNEAKRPARKPLEVTKSNCCLYVLWGLGLAWFGAHPN